ncbi:MAG TPA: hypothetical protein VHG08_12895 [Longimicrobium sp.]|nr:hypothetical protein [Longimicrobium sp.]
MTHPQSHPPDEALLAWLEGEGTAADRRALRLHLRACGECRERARSLRSLARGVLGRIAELDDGPAGAFLPPTLAGVRARRRPGITRSRPPLRWAAALVALATTGAVLASPLPQRVREWLGGSAREPAQRTVPIPHSTPQTGGPIPRRPSQELRFVPERGEFRVEMPGPAAGSITLTRTEGTEAVFTVATAEPGVHPVLLLPDGIQVNHRGSAATDYTLALPPRVSLVRLRIGGRPEVLVRRAQIRPEGMRIPPGSSEPGP